MFYPQNCIKEIENEQVTKSFQRLVQVIALLEQYEVKTMQYYILCHIAENFGE